MCLNGIPYTLVLRSSDRTDGTTNSYRVSVPRFVTEPEGTKFLLRCVGFCLDPNNLPRCTVEVRVDFGSPSQSYDTATRGRASVVALASTYGEYLLGSAVMVTSQFSSVSLISTPSLVVNNPDMAVVNVKLYNQRRNVLLTQYAEAAGDEADGAAILDSILILELTPIE